MSVSFGGAFEMETSAPLCLCLYQFIYPRQRGAMMRVNVRGKVTAFSCENGDVDIVHSSNFLHHFGEAEVVVPIECIQLLWQIEGDDGDVASGLQSDFLLDLRHC